MTHFDSRRGFAIAACLVLATIESPANDLVWNDTTGAFTGSPTWSYDSAGSVATNDNPFLLPGAGGGFGGENTFFIGADGDVTLNTSTPLFGVDNYLFGGQVGTDAERADLSTIGGPDGRGNGTLTVTGANPLFIDDPNENTSSGDLFIAQGAGTTGTVNWDSSGTLNVSSRLRVGQGGTGTFNQNGGTVITAQKEGGGKFMAVGSVGGSGAYNLNDGRLEVGAAMNPLTALAVRRITRISFNDGSTGVMNLGDGVGSAGSAVFETWDEINVGDGGVGSNGTLVVNSDGRVRINAPNLSDPDIRLRIGAGTGTGLVQLNGGQIDIVSRLDIGAAGGNGTLQIIGDSGSIDARALQVGNNGNLQYDFVTSGVTPITLGGSAITSDDPSLGINIESGAPLLTLNSFSSYGSNDEVRLVDSLDSAATVAGLFSNLSQGASVGTNALGTEFFINYFGGDDSNDLVLQSTLPSSVTVGLAWAAGTANFDSGFFRSNGDFAAEAMPTNPLGSGEEVFLANGGTAVLDDTTDFSAGDAVFSLQVGTTQASARVAGTNGAGTLTANGSANLTVTDAVAGPNAGLLVVGGDGTTGTLNWNSSGTLTVEGRARFGLNGTATVNQNAGTIVGGNTAGGSEYLSVAEGTGATAVYNLNSGVLNPGGGAFDRLLRIGFLGGEGEFNLGDGVGAAGDALIDSTDDINVGLAPGSVGRMTIESDGEIVSTSGTSTLAIGLNNAEGTVIQNGGSVSIDHLATVGALGVDAIGVYEINGGSFAVTGATGLGEFRLGDNGGNGTVRLRNDASFSVANDLVIGIFNDTDSNGRLEISGSEAAVDVGRLRTAEGNNATIAWEADADGVSALIVEGDSTLDTGAFVQLQDEDLVPLNTGGPGSLMGDGIAIELDLSALTGDQTLLLIDNQSVESIAGFFEEGSSMDLYEEGESIFGTGFIGDVSISYTGGDGNDVVLSLVGGTALPGDFNADGIVNAVDYTVWRDNLGAATETSLNGAGDGQNGVDANDYTLWAGNYGAQRSTSSAVPEPATAWLSLITLATACPSRRRVPILAA